MKKSKMFFLLAALVAAGCSSQDTADKVSVNAAANNTNKAPAEAAAANQAPAGETGVEGAEANPVLAMKNARLQELRKGPSSVSTTDVDVKAPSRPAPENSEYSVSLGKTAVELRVFRDNPSISKVEKTNDGKKSLVKIYLKNGKVVELPGEKIENLGSISSAEILSIANLAKRPPSADTLNETKKPAN